MSKADYDARIAEVQRERDEARALQKEYRAAMFAADNDAAMVRACWKVDHAKLETAERQLSLSGSARIAMLSAHVEKLEAQLAEARELLTRIRRSAVMMNPSSELADIDAFLASTEPGT